MSKPFDVLELFREFRKYQKDNNEPYSFDLLGFWEWLEFQKGIKI